MSAQRFCARLRAICREIQAQFDANPNLDEISLKGVVGKRVVGAAHAAGKFR